MYEIGYSMRQSLVLVGSSRARVVHGNPLVDLNLKPRNSKPPKDQATFQISALVSKMTRTQYTYFSRASETL
jgi:hypothetical protein